MQARKKRRIGKRILGLLCAAALLLETAPLILAAQGIPAAPSAQAETSSGAQIIGEVADRRAPTSRCFA